MYRILFTDIDGTLLSHTTNSIPASAIETVKKLQAQGIQVWGCTGRHTEELKKMNLEGFDPDGWVTLNGALCLKGEEVLYAAPITDGDLEILVNTVKETPFAVQFMEKDRMYNNMLSEELIQGLSNIHTDPDPIVDIEEVGRSPLYMFVPWGPKDIVDDMLGRMKHVKWVRWNDYAVDAFSDRCGKSFGIRAVCSALGITKEEVIAIGDAENDLSMFSEAGLSIAVGNAMESVKAAAVVVSDHIDNDGFAKAFMNIIEK